MRSKTNGFSVLNKLIKDCVCNHTGFVQCQREEETKLASFWGCLCGAGVIHTAGIMYL